MTIIDLSIVSGTYKRLPLLQKMVASVRTSINPGLTYEIILVGVEGDNETIAWCRTQRDIKLLLQPGLQGAISAFNEGGHAAQGRYTVFLNDDLTVVSDTLTLALIFMQNNPEVGIGAMHTDRQRGWQVAGMHARLPDGSPTILPYNGCSIFPTWLGRKLDFWALPGARTYGGDNALVCRIVESGWKAVALPQDCGVKETIPSDELNRLNNERPEGTRDHPDTLAYRKVYPYGPQIRIGKRFEAPAEVKPPLRILYAPIYEEKHVVQHQQKCGLRRALQHIGSVYEVDYLETGPDSILKAATLWRPQLMVLQLHYPEPFTPEHMRQLRQHLPGSTIVTWNGDVYDMTAYPREKRTKNGKETVADAYVRMLRMVDLHTVVNAQAVLNFGARGVTCRYWQLGYEPEGVGHEPLPSDSAYDVLFLGNGYSANRQRFGDFLQTLSCRLGVYGHGWPQLQTHPANTYDFRQGCRLYRRAQIALGDSEWASTARGFVSNRAFQAMAAGHALMLQQAFDGTELIGLADGKHWVLWTDYADLREKIAYYLDPRHEAERAKIAAAGQVEVLTHHSFESRVAELLTMLREQKQRVAEPTNADPTLTIFHKGI